MARPVRLVFLADDAQLQAALRRTVASTSSTQAALRKLEKTGADLHKLGRSMVLGLTVPILGVATAAVVMATKYEAAMTRVQTLAGGSSAQVKQWSKDLLALAPALGRAPQELADGLYYIMSSGAKASDALNILVVSAKAASVGLGETKDVADLVTSVMNAYGSKNISAAHATDILIRAVKDGKGEPAQFAHNMGQILPIAAELGIGFADVAAGMAAITIKGDSAAEAVTKLRQIMAKLLKPTVAGSNLLTAIGLSPDAIKQLIKTQGLLATLNTIKGRVTAFATEPVAAKTAALGIDKKHPGTSTDKRLLSNNATQDLATIFNDVRGLQGVLSLTGKSAADTAAIFKDVGASGGDLDKAFGATQQTNMFKMQSALAGLKAAGIQLGMELVPYVSKAATFVSHLAIAFMRLSPATRDTIIKIALLVAALGPLLYGMGGVLKIFTGMYKHPLITMISLLVIGFITLYSSNAKFRVIVGQVVKVLGDLAHWVGQNRALLLSLAGGAAAFFTVLRGAKVIEQTVVFMRMFGIGGVQALRMIIGVGPMFRTAIAGFRAAWLALNSTFLFSPIGLIIAGIVALVAAFIIAYKTSGTFRNFVHAALRDVAAVAKVVAHDFVVAFHAVWTWVDKYLVPVFRVLFMVWMFEAKVAIKIIVETVKFLIPVFKVVVAIVVWAVTMIIRWIKFWASILIPAVKAWWLVFSTVWSAILSLVVGIVKVIVAVISGFAKLVWAVWTGVWNIVYAVTKTAVSGLVNEFRFVYAFVAGWVLEVLRVVSGAFSAVYNAVAGPVKKIWSIITSVFTTVNAWVAKLFNGWIGFFAGIWSKLWGLFSGGASKIRDFVVRVFQGTANAVAGAFSAVSGVVRNAINSVISRINSIAIPKVTLLGVVVFPGWKMPPIPHLAVGGFVDKPTMALIGEAGKELVLPLTNRARSMELLAKSGLFGRQREVSPSAHNAGSSFAAAAPASKGKTVHIEHLEVHTQATSPAEVGREVAWQLRTLIL